MKKVIVLTLFCIFLIGCATTSSINLAALSDKELANYYYNTLSELENVKQKYQDFSEGRSEARSDNKTNYPLIKPKKRATVRKISPRQYEIEYEDSSPFLKGLEAGRQRRQNAPNPSTNILKSYLKESFNRLKRRLIAIRAEMYNRGMEAPY